ncbi:hypothetical protein [Croceicoccus bisphenolivorans]|uniref:hypothetical protein n=1 Tax=Croceicoccus bisphenolivorans TaxID=1783232 RepID=UPI00082EAFED|nr:hypothetical protein [Croceicoccus bisphenolivorans]
MFEIEKGVPLPEKGNVRTGVANALRQMEVGDSFVIPTEATNKNRLSSAFSRFYMTKCGAGKRFSQRKTPDGFRIWRTA